MQRRFSNDELAAIRNFVPFRKVLQDVLQIPNKEQEGFLRFLCPCCGEFRAAVHPVENLGRCFLCERNFNPIELVMAERKLGFVDTVRLLQRHIQ